MPLCIPRVIERFDDQHIVYAVTFITGKLVAELRVAVTPGSVEILDPTDAWGRAQPLPVKRGSRAVLAAPKKLLSQGA